MVAKNCSLVMFSAQGEAKRGTFSGSNGGLGNQETLYHCIQSIIANIYGEEGGKGGTFSRSYEDWTESGDKCGHYVRERESRPL